jgi:hypothetical protein
MTQHSVGARTTNALGWRRFGLYAAVALPPLALAIIGTTHPHHLTAASALYWRNLHVITLPIFPLLGFAPWLIARFQRMLVVTWAAGVLGFVFAAFYTGLDVLAGIGAGGLKLDGMGMATSTVFGLGDGLGNIGAIALIAAVVLVGIVSILGVGASAIPGSLLAFAGSVGLYQDHIFFPVGVLGQIGLAAGWVVLVIALRRGRTASPATPTVRPAPLPS